MNVNKLITWKWLSELYSFEKYLSCAQKITNNDRKWLRSLRAILSHKFGNQSLTFKILPCLKLENKIFGMQYQSNQLLISSISSNVFVVKLLLCWTENVINWQFFSFKMGMEKCCRFVWKHPHWDRSMWENWEITDLMNNLINNLWHSFYPIH